MLTAPLARRRNENDLPPNMFKMRALRICAISPAPQQQDRPFKRQRLSICIPDTVTDDSDSDYGLRQSSGPAVNVLRPLFVWHTAEASPFPSLTTRPDAVAPGQAELLRT
jgi:hypothetical protein